MFEISFLLKEEKEQNDDEPYFSSNTSDISEYLALLRRRFVIY